MKMEANLAGVPVGGRHPVRIMGVINLSPESFFKNSVQLKARSLIREVKTMTRDGADFIDVGAMSTAPYLKTAISEKEEARRLAWAIPIIRDHSDCPISVDTSRPRPAEMALHLGAQILNDIHGLWGQGLKGPLLKGFSGFILMAHPDWLARPSRDPILNVHRIFKSIAKKTHAFKLDQNRIVLDPGIGFFRYPHIPWWQWDLNVLGHLHRLTKVGFPLMVGVSRKSFLGHILGGQPPEDRLPASLAATLVAVQNGAAMIRTHDVKATKDAIITGEWFLKKASRKA